MQQGAKLQASRYEFKYLIAEGRALAIRRFVGAYLPPDRYTAAWGDIGYPVHSLYLDSPDLKLCQQTICGEKNRYKLRIRFYDDCPDRPVFLETKRRVYDVIVKARVAVWRAAVPALLSDYLPKRSYLFEETDRNERALRDFCELARRFRADLTVLHVMQSLARSVSFHAAGRHGDPGAESAYREKQEHTLDRFLQACDFHNVRWKSVLLLKTLWNQRVQADVRRRHPLFARK